MSTITSGETGASLAAKPCSASFFAVVVFVCSLALGNQASAYDTDREKRTEANSTQTPKELEGVGVVEKLGDSVDLGLQFTNELGVLAPLSTYFTSHRPVLLAIVYYGCPHLCTYQFDGMIDTFNKMKGSAGVDYDVVTVSMDVNEKSELAAQKKSNYMKTIKQADAEKGWHMLVGDKKNVETLAQQVGFSFRWNEEQKEFAHHATLIILTPDGTISRYLNGISYEPTTLRMAVVEASNGKVGSFMEQATLACFKFDPAKSVYTIAAFRLVQGAAIFTILLLMILIVPVWLREKNRKPQEAKSLS